jgi:ribosomal protein L7Ae-like RNA K-turn-binding protein
MSNRLHGYLGLANRAGKALVGEAIIKVWEKRKIHLLLIAQDAKSRTVEKLVKRAQEQNITIKYVLSKAELGLALGFNEVSSIALCDKGLAQQIILVIKEELE